MSFASRKVRSDAPDYVVPPVVAGTDNHPVHDRLCNPSSFTGMHRKQLQRPSASRPLSQAARWRTERPGPPLDTTAMLGGLSGHELNIAGRSADFRAQTDWRRGLRSAGGQAPPPVRRPASTRTRLRQLLPYLSQQQQQQQPMQPMRLAMPVNPLDKTLLFQAIGSPALVAPEQLAHLLVPAAPTEGAPAARVAAQGGAAQGGSMAAEPAGGLSAAELRREQRQQRQQQRAASKALKRAELEHELAAVQMQRDLHERQRQIQQEQLAEVERLRTQHEEQLELLQQRQRDARALLGRDMALRAAVIEQTEAQQAEAQQVGSSTVRATDSGSRRKGLARELEQRQRETVRRFQLAAVEQASSPAAKAKAGTSGMGRVVGLDMFTREQSQLASSRRRRNQEELRKRNGGVVPAAAFASRRRRQQTKTAEQPPPQQEQAKMMAPEEEEEEELIGSIDMRKLNRPSHPKILRLWYDDEM